MKIPKLSRKEYTKIFLKQADKCIDDVNVSLHMYSWWYSHNSKSVHNLRLSDEGYEFLTKTMDMTAYIVSFNDPVQLSPQCIIYISKYLDSPYYITDNSIIVFSSYLCTELNLFANDLNRYGLSKAMRNPHRFKK